MDNNRPVLLEGMPLSFEEQARIKKLKQEYETPDDFWSVIREEFRPDSDVAASAGNAKCDRFLTEEDNALSNSRPWLIMHQHKDVAWCNPPFRNMMPWVQKAYAEAQKVHNGCVLVLGPTSNAKWMRFCHENASEIRLLCGTRIEFVLAPGLEITANKNMHDNVLVVFRKKLTKQPAHTFLWDWRAALAELASPEETKNNEGTE